MSDPVRLRVLHLLFVEELSVGELVRILELPQSTVSRHLKALREEGLIADRAAGPSTYYQARLEADLGNGETSLRDSLVQFFQNAKPGAADRVGLQRVLALRQQDGEAFFDQIGLRWDTLRESCFGHTFHLEVFLALLPREWTVADLGTGTGYLLPALGRHFSKVIAVDSSVAMLELAARRVEDAGIQAGGTPAPLEELASPRGEKSGQQGNVLFIEGELEHLPLPDQSVDLALAFLMLHHLADVPAALSEIRRILRPCGQLLLVEIHPHSNENFRVRMADRRAGIAQDQMSAWLEEAGFEDAAFHDLDVQHRPEHELAPLPKLYAATAVIKVSKVAAASRRLKSKAKAEWISLERSACPR